MHDLAHPSPAHTPLWHTRGGLALCGFLAVAGFYLLAEHTLHVFWALPYLLLLGCPLMHLFMHHGHGGRDHVGHANQTEQHHDP
jgi:hypothetical protein